MKVKKADAQRAVEVLKDNYIKSTGLTSEDISAAQAVFDTEAEHVTCPACAARFKPDINHCPDCGLQFG